VNSYI